MVNRRFPIMVDRFNRTINYLRISVTDKCNLRCIYCMPEEGVPQRLHEDFLSFEAMTEVVREGIDLGISKVRLTGGEPLVKQGILTLVSMLKSAAGVPHLSMTTNGTLLGNLARGLREAGLDSLNISLDTLDPKRYHRLTRVGDIRAVLGGIEAARSAGFPVKLNMVVLEDTAPQEVERMRRFCREKNLKLQLINHFSLTEKKKNHYRFDRPPDCRNCNRIRLLADGYLKPCLHSDAEVKLDLSDIRGSLRRAIEMKPEQGSVCNSRRMIEIGG